MIRIYISFALLFLFALNSFAGLYITPARSEIIIEPDSSYDGSYLIQNGYDSKVIVGITARNWNNSVENKDVKIDEWLTLYDKSVELMPGDKKEVKYTVKSGGLKGSLSGMISFTIKSPDHVGINLMTSVPVYMTVAGTQNVEYEIAAVELQSQNVSDSVEQGRKINALVKVNNTGNVHLRLSGNMKVIQGKNTVLEQKISEQSPVYPGNSRSFSFLLGTGLPKGKYVLNISLNGSDKTVEKNIQFRVNKYGDVSF